LESTWKRLLDVWMNFVVGVMARVLEDHQPNKMLLDDCWFIFYAYILLVRAMFLSCWLHQGVEMCDLVPWERRKLCWGSAAKVWSCRVGWCWKFGVSENLCQLSERCLEFIISI
jgi:hypothetical protein